MKTITFTCETITPMFLSGADGQTPELRPPSIKGAMRFWWRAMNGHLVKYVKANNTYDYSDFNKAEIEIFGGSYKVKDNDKIVTLKSKFSISIENIDLKECCLDDLKEYAGKYIDSSRKEIYKKRGLEYFLYTFLHQNKDKEGRSGLKTESKFKVSIYSHDDRILKEASMLFWILSTLGSLGTRSRRGLGCFRIKNITAINFKLSELSYVSMDDGKIKLKNIVARDKVIEMKNADFLSSHSVYTKKVYVSKDSFDRWEDALNKIAIEMRNVRDRMYNKSLEFTTSDLNKKAAFGLPLTVFNEKKTVNLKIEEDETRRASPLYITVKMVNKKYRWVVVYLEGVFMPSDSRIVFRVKDGGWKIQDDILLTQFLENISELC